MNSKKFLTAMVLAGFALGSISTSTLAKSNYNYTSNIQNNNSNLQGYALFVPAGITCQAVLSQEINSQSATVGQTINAILTQDFIYNNQTI